MSINQFAPPHLHVHAYAQGTVQRENYSSLDGLRAYAAIGVVLMHVQANMLAHKPSVNIITESVIPWFSHFTLLFMIISAFSMCCGYYDRVRNGVITPAEFYAKRYHRTWPFFAMMVLISFAIEPSWSTFCQSFADLTLCFNLLPNPNIEVVGVGWFLGTVFTFYMVFPFFTYLLNNRKKAWMVMGLSLVFCYIAITYFSTSDFVVKPIDMVNIIYSAPFFIAGGLVYLYRHGIKKRVEGCRLITLVVCIILTVIKFAVKISGAFILPDLIVFTAWLIYAVGSHDPVLNNSVVRYLGGISMEIYLCHMMFFHVADLLYLERFIHSNDVLYVTNCVITLIGAICFSHIVKYKLFTFLKNKCKKLYKI